MSCVPFEPDFSCCEEWSSLDQQLRDRAVDLAWSALRTLTGSQVGNCPTLVRPCLTDPCPACLDWRGRPGGPDSGGGGGDGGPYTDEVHIGTTDPGGRYELWFDPDAIPNIATPWLATTAAGDKDTSDKDEVHVGTAPPYDVGVELWYNHDAWKAGSVPARRNLSGRQPIAPGVHLVDGNWYNSPCSTTECSCSRMCEIVVPSPVAALVAVYLDGEEMDLEHFRIDNANRIVRTDYGCWPSCQDMTAELCDRGTLGIVYVPGIVPDSSALWAAGVLACEFAKACNPSALGGKCRLPTGVTSIARQGVTMTMGESMFPGGMTGIREVDAYVMSVNPHGLKMPPMVWSPDVSWAKHRYVTPTAKMVP